MNKNKIKEIIEETASDFLKENNLELYNVDFSKAGKDWFLRVYIDVIEDDSDEEEKYVSTDDCEKVSRYLSEKLDESDPIEQNYYLEVSSPGMDRELFTQKHFDKFAGKLVDVKLYKATEGKKTYEGELVGLIDGNVVIKEENGIEIAFPQDQVAKTSLTVVF